MRLLGDAGAGLRGNCCVKLLCISMIGFGVWREGAGIMQSALDLFLRRFINVGRLTVHWPDGRTRIYAGRPGPEARVALRDRRTVRRLALDPELGVGEAYMAGNLVPLDGSIHDVLAVIIANLRANPDGLSIVWLRRWIARMFRALDQFNAAGRARRNAAITTT